MPNDEERTEGSEQDGDPFAEKVSPALEFIIDRWGLKEASGNAAIVIQGRISRVSFIWKLKRGKYNADSVDGMLVYEPENLKCDIPVYHPKAAIAAARGDLGIVSEVFRAFGSQMGMDTQAIMVRHMKAVYPEPPPPEEPRVSAGERREQDTEPEEY